MGLATYLNDFHALLQAIGAHTVDVVIFGCAVIVFGENMRKSAKKSFFICISENYSLFLQPHDDYIVQLSY